MICGVVALICTTVAAINLQYHYYGLAMVGIGLSLYNVFTGFLQLRQYWKKDQ